MNKVKSLLKFTALMGLMLTSCGTKSHHGMYQFQMGKATDSHIGIYMDLSKEKIEVEVDDDKKETMEKFNVKFAVPESIGDKEEQSLIGGLLTYFEDGLYGGYKIQHDDKNDYDRLYLYPIIDIASLIEQIEEQERGEEGSSSNPEESSSQESSSSEEPFVIPSKYIDDIMIAKYDKETISVTVPVSLTDLMFQLYWYGFDIMNIIDDVPVVAHEHGTHPTEEDIDEINKTYNSDERLFKHVDLDALVKYQVLKQVDYRDFNQLTMTLKKAEKL